jgi:glycosyltransferase involved in cell wall biosynthesis
MTVYNYFEYFITNKIDVSVSALAIGPMSKLFDDIGVRVNIELPNINSIQHHDVVVVNSLIRYDATEFLSKNKIAFFQYIHEDWEPKDFIGGINERWGWYLPRWENFYKYLQESKAVIFPAKYLMEKYPKDLKKYTIYNPVNERNLKNIRYSEEFKNGFDIINIGTINPRKNQRLLLEICISNRSKINSCRLFGERRIRDYEIIYIDDLIQIANKHNDLKLIIEKTQFPLSFEYYATSVFVITSLAEVLPCTIQEMMHVGITVVAPRNFGIPEIINDGVNGFLYDIENAEYEIISILNTLNDKKLKSKIETSAKSFSKENFDMSVNGQILLDLFQGRLK